MAVKTKDQPKQKPKSDTAQWVENAAKHAGLNYAALGRLLNDRLQKNFDRSMPSKMAADKRQVTAEEMIAIAELTGFALPDALIPRSLSGSNKKSSTVPPSTGHHSDVNLPEPSIENMPFWNRDDGFPVRHPELTAGERLREFFAPYLSGGVENKFEIWKIMANVVNNGPCKAGAFLVVEKGVELKYELHLDRVVLAETINKKRRIFRYWVGDQLVDGSDPPMDIEPLIVGREAVVLGLVVAGWYKGAKFEF